MIKQFKFYCWNLNPICKYCIIICEPVGDFDLGPDIQIVDILVRNT